YFFLQLFDKVIGGRFVQDHPQGSLEFRMQGKFHTTAASGDAPADSTEDGLVRGQYQGVGDQGLWGKRIYRDDGIGIGIADDGHIGAEQKGLEQLAKDPNPGTRINYRGDHDNVVPEPAFK